MMSSRTKEIKANWEKVNNLLQGATFECIDNDLDIVLRTADDRTIVVSSYFECLSIHTVNETVNITPQNFIDSETFNF